MSGEKIRTTLGNNIKLFRNRRNWSQSDLAESAGISINYLGEIERGRKWPHPETLWSLTEALNVEVFELFHEESMQLPLDTQVILNRFLNDVFSTIKKSVHLSVGQSIDDFQKLYNIEKTTNIYYVSPKDQLHGYAAEEATKSKKTNKPANSRRK